MNKVEITITVDWGRKSKDCEGFGICGIVIDIDIPMDTFFSFKKDGRRSLELFFQKEKHKEIVKYFGGERIILEEGYTLDLKTSQKLGFEKAYTIEKGEYPIVYDAKQGFYKITL
ncbi:MAG TPA: hypothetical protein VFM70_00290 [Salinimicrobium sp.]|nr:hypothetical protein [Salinimicrobium sp.]